MFCPQITPIDADEELVFSVSASICNLRAIPDSAAIGRVGIFALFCGQFILGCGSASLRERLFAANQANLLSMNHLHSQMGHFQSSLIKPNQA